MRSGDRAAAAKAKQSRDALVAEVRRGGRAQRKRG
jgi:hypothetical protein